jgi:ABC-type iron transport system FetAB permease component
MRFVAHFSMKLTHNHAVGVMVLVTLMWSTAGVVTRHLESARSFEVTFWRSFFTVLALFVLVPMLRGPSIPTPMGKMSIWCLPSWLAPS